jgi:uncharacterized protein YgiM (DUF1202 family)
MKKQLLTLILCLPGILYATLTHADSTYYVQSDNANVRAEPSFGAKVIAKVAKGQTLTSLSKDGSWIKVKVDGKEGYISSLLVSSHAPLDKPAITKTADETDAKPTARRRASSYTSAAAARGLTDEEKNSDGVVEKSNYKAVDKMESIKVTPEEVKKFKETGK